MPHNEIYEKIIDQTLSHLKDSLYTAHMIYDRIVDEYNTLVQFRK